MPKPPPADKVVRLQPKQRQLLALVSDPAGPTWIGYGGSRGGAKSYALRAVLLLRALSAPNRRLMLLRRTWPQLRENHVEPMRAEFPALFAAGWHEQNRELTLPNGSVIAFRYAENAADVNAMIGKEYWIAAVDQAEMFTERELVVIKSCCRSTEDTARIVLTFNPGNVGLRFLKRVFADRAYRPGEDAADYGFIQAYGWDNVEWARAALARRRLSIADYLAWDEQKRFEFFITATQYGKELNALPQALRIGWLLGEMGKFSGQFYDNFDPERHIVECQPAHWQDRWLGIDWGFAHNSCALWLSRSETGAVQVYREFAASGRSPKALAQEIVDRTPPPERKHIVSAWLSHDAFARVDERDTIADQMGQVFGASGLPAPWPATRDLVGSAALVYELLRAQEMVIDPACQSLIAAIPMVSRDPLNPERPVKFLGDDAFDALRYGLKDRLGSAGPPRDVVLAREAAAITDPVARWFHLLRARHERPAGGLEPFQPRYARPWSGGA